MPSIYFFYLGLVLTSVVANDAMSTTPDSSSPETMNSSTAGTVGTNSTTSMLLETSTTTETLKTLETNGSMNASDSNTNTTSTPADRNETQTSDGGVATTTIPMKTSSRPTARTEKMSPTTKRNPTTKQPPPKKTGSSEATGIIIVVVIALVIVAFAVACFVSRRRGRRYSVDFAASPDENVPLSTIDPEVRAVSAPQNGLKTFESPETASPEPKGPEVAPETQEEKKGEAVISAAAPSTEAAAPPEAAAAAPPEAAAPAEAPAAAPSPDSSEEKPKADEAKQSSSEPADPLAEEKTDDEGAVSNKTSVESLKETNENNSNNSSSSQRRDWKRSNIIWEVGVDCPV